MMKSIEKLMVVANVLRVHFKIQIKNAKIKSEHLEKICYCFSKDYTAIETAKQTGFSRQTINHYYTV